MFELEIDGKPFSEVWDKVKYKNVFLWETGDKTNLDMRQFGEQIQSTKDTQEALDSQLREHEIEQISQLEVKKSRSKAKRVENFESGFDSVFDQLSTYSGEPVPI